MENVVIKIEVMVLLFEMKSCHEYSTDGRSEIILVGSTRGLI